MFAKQQRLSQRPLDECPAATLPKRLRPYLLMFDAEGTPTGLHADRYEFWLYRQVRKRFQAGELYIDDSLQHRHLSDELVSMDEKAAVLAQMDIPFLRQPVSAQLDALATELRAQWVAFNRELKQGKLTHLEYDKDTQRLTWRKPRGEPEGARASSLRATAILRCRRRVSLRQRPVPVPVGADTIAATLCEEGSRRRQSDGGDHCPP